MSGTGVPPPPPPLKSDADLAIVDTKRASLIADHKSNDISSDEDSIDLNKEIYDSTAIGPVLAKRMALANSAIDEIGMTGFQWNLFYRNGFGCAVDSGSPGQTIGFASRTYVLIHNSSLCASPFQVLQSHRNSAIRVRKSPVSPSPPRLDCSLVQPYGDSART